MYVQVPDEGEYYVLDGDVRSVEESAYRGSDGELDQFVIYLIPKDDDE